MKQQIPRGHEHLICPLHRASCDTVCHKCPWWLKIQGVNPNTDERIDYWGCAVEVLPSLTMSVAQQVRHSSASTDSFRNEVVQRLSPAALSNSTPLLLEG